MSTRQFSKLFGLLACVIILASSRTVDAEKLRDLCDVVGARDNQLIGYGVVTGLSRTGDDIMAPFAAQSLVRCYEDWAYRSTIRN